MVFGVWQSTRTTTTPVRRADMALSLLLREAMLLCRLVALLMALMMRQFRKEMINRGSRPEAIIKTK